MVAIQDLFAPSLAEEYNLHMRRVTFWLAVAILTFAIGVGFAALWSGFRNSSPQASVEEKSSAPTLVEKKRIYKWTIHTSGMADGYDAAFSTFHSTDGMKFSMMSVYYNSPRQAEREFQKRLKESIEVIKREPFLDEDGRQIGEQVIATFPSRLGASTISAELIWTRGKDLISIRSSSLENILEYMKDQSQ